ncbi:DEAD/DEAH box helicase family protein [Anaerosporobacter faecicola]|uniref:DEAD/DEAH box helicase family protein n=1 Tax=Anaerosporobacter faecicola TaxID=2718714 RepID=UPI00143C17C2|nr:DEAD/DEAH box helicase family protein [Anaerosporobacter faecicola]
MCTNFDFLKSKSIYTSFAEQAIEAEKSLLVSPATSAILSRRAMELSVKWVYGYDNDLRIPYQNNISSLIHEQSFRDIIEPKLFPMIKYVIQLGNKAVHTNENIKRDDAILSLRNLHEFIRWIDYCYSDEYTCGEFDEDLLEESGQARKRPEENKEYFECLSEKDLTIEQMRKENEALRSELTKQRQDHVRKQEFKVDELCEAQTRQKYIDVELSLAGWKMDVDCQVEVEVEGMPNPTGIGYVDYVLFGNNGKPLAVIEAKKASKDTIIGSQQAKLYADCLRNKYGQRPLIFTTNGFEFDFTNDYDGYTRRSVSGIFTKEELQLMIDRRSSRKPFENVEINDNISNRYYQKEAIMSVCNAVDRKQRKMLLVMATGSGKTRTAISIVDVLMRHNYVKNVLFLADRTALVKQAKKNFTNLLPSLSVCNLLDSKDNPEQARMIFSTYPTMLNAIDEKKSKDGRKLFTPGHFDLIIVDESHRSIYKKYQDIFVYFDAMLLGLTATPKDEIDKNTYSVFDLENGVPTFAYELEKAVEDEYLVDYKTIEVKTKIMENGIHYNELSEEEKEQYESTFEDDETVQEDIDSNAINEWLFNDSTIDRVLSDLMEKGIKVEGGDKIGKTIIFAKNSLHAKAIVERFHTMYPHLGNDFIKQIDYSIKYVDSLIDDFSTKDKLPQIAVSVDMLDTGIDIPEVLNLVFFKKIRSKSKFWQMIGRGTRLCKDLFGVGMDKEGFLIFDYCNNFEFFRMNPKGIDSAIGESLTEKIYNTKLEIARELQDIRYQEQEYIEYRNKMVSDLLEGVRALNMESFRVKLHLRQVEAYREEEVWQQLNTANVMEVKEHISPIINPIPGDELAKRFDYLIYTVDLAYLQSKNASKPIQNIVSTAEQLSKLGTIPQVLEQKAVIERVQTSEFWDNADVFELEKVRVALRDLLKFIERGKQVIYYTDFKDEVLEVNENEAMYNTNDLKNYQKKVEFYLKEHSDMLAVYKLRNNKKLNQDELKQLEHILWEELGSKADYEKEYGDTPVSILVRKMVGLDRAAANEAFSEFLSEEKLNVNQIRFVKLIIDYVVANGMIEDNRVLTEEPFRTLGSISVLFKDNMTAAKGIMGVIREIKKNSESIA